MYVDTPTPCMVDFFRKKKTPNFFRPGAASWPATNCKYTSLEKKILRTLLLMPSQFTFATVIVRWISLRFSLRFGGHRRWLRATIFMFTLFTVIVRFHVLGIVELPKTKPYRGCTEIVQRLCDDRADIIRSYDFCTMLFCSPVEKKIVRSLHDQRKASAR